MIVIKTTRLNLRQLTIDDAENLYLLNLDPDVARYTGDSPFESAEEAGRFLASYDQYEKYGCGRWAVITSRDSEFIGWCGLSYTPGLDEYDIGFRFFKSKWNQGYATESARACIDHGFEKLKLERIVGRAMKENTASLKVLEKIGLKFVKPIVFSDHEGLVYEIENSGEEK